MNSSRQPTPPWFPQVDRDARILVVGASGGMGQALVDALLAGPPCTIGAHWATRPLPDQAVPETHRLVELPGELKNDADCRNLVSGFAERGGGLNGLVVLCGGIARTAHFQELTETEWKQDIDLNLSIPFFLARAALKHMENSGGSILLTGTESALHGGSPTSLAYGVAKRGIECLVQGLAREGAPHGIRVNGIRFGFIRTGFHERWQGKSDTDLEERAELVPLKRAGTPEEAAALILFLLSGWAGFITGQMISLSGGDWL